MPKISNINYNKILTPEDIEIIDATISFIVNVCTVRDVFLIDHKDKIMLLYLNFKKNPEIIQNQELKKVLKKVLNESFLDENSWEYQTITGYYLSELSNILSKLS